MRLSLRFNLMAGVLPLLFLTGTAHAEKYWFTDLAETLGNQVQTFVYSVQDTAFRIDSGGYSNGTTVTVSCKDELTKELYTPTSVGIACDTNEVECEKHNGFLDESTSLTFVCQDHGWVHILDIACTPHSNLTSRTATLHLSGNCQ